MIQFRCVPARGGEKPIIDCWVEALVGRWIIACRIMPAYSTREPVIGEIRIFPEEPQRQHVGQWSAETRGIRAQAPAGGITKKIIAKIDLRERASIFDELLCTLSRGDWSLHPLHPEMTQQAIDAFSAPQERQRTPKNVSRLAIAARSRRGRRRTVSDIELARMAQDYITLLRLKKYHVARTIKKRYRLKTEGQVRMRLLRAKERGLIARFHDDRAMVTLTPTGRAILYGAERDQLMTVSEAAHIKAELQPIRDEETK